MSKERDSVNRDRFCIDIDSYTSPFCIDTILDLMTPLGENDSFGDYCYNNEDNTNDKDVIIGGPALSKWLRKSHVDHYYNSGVGELLSEEIDRVISSKFPSTHMDKLMSEKLRKEIEKVVNEEYRDMKENLLDNFDNFKSMKEAFMFANTAFGDDNIETKKDIFNRYIVEFFIKSLGSHSERLRKQENCKIVKKIANCIFGKLTSVESSECLKERCREIFIDFLIKIFFVVTININFKRWCKLNIRASFC
jgi:hypothetical protein